ncbi:RHS repeat-associated core domain-containing protein [Pseudomonas sp. 14P_8.1_Bac3]|uniref:RHS repeat-associated core domain-containing protein n=1 Tax=Pseudomonas sp. 14P_8.1_Bac3 TaxID=2971621 RepID=UPI0021C862FB|nr:RHS repeat-associated core domain-containing protein [Pseudomonas sp. 14P_8.1_Bac3]MCU1762986.1 RHS repeat-associated core domain-containing protein [Pseudomonas sp. 14P_8.1_Bac3]
MRAHSGKTTLLASDQQRSVLGVLSPDRADPIAYMPFGHHPRESALLSGLGFNGELPDPLTGHYHLGKGYRPYSPVLMRFIKPDRESPFRAGGFNAYVYCGGNPVGRVDPSGRAWRIPKAIKRFFKKPKWMKKNSSASVVIADSSSALPDPTKTITTPPFNSDKTVNNLRPEDLVDDLDLAMFEPGSRSSEAPRRRSSTSIDYSQYPPMQARGQYDTFLKNTERTALVGSNASMQELTEAHKLLSEIPGPSSAADRVDAARANIRERIDEAVVRQYWKGNR